MMGKGSAVREVAGVAFGSGGEGCRQDKTMVRYSQMLCMVSDGCFFRFFHLKKSEKLPVPSAPPVRDLTVP